MDASPNEKVVVQDASEKVQISVVIPAYNASAYISECLESVLKQVCSHLFEVIVVDDGSRDDTYDLVRRNFPPVRLLQKPNGGPGSARNVGVKNALGEIIVFIDADDIMLPGRLAFQSDFMLNNPEYGLTFGNQRFQLDPTYDSNRARGICDSDNLTEVRNGYARLLMSGNFVANTTCAVRRDAYLQAGGQPENIFVGEDYAMNCAIFREWRIASACRFLTWYRQGHGDNLMASPHTYRDPVAVLSAELLNHGQRLSLAQYRHAFVRWCAGANMLLRWVWTEGDHNAVRNEMETLRPLLPAYLYAKWFTLSLLPSSFGRTARAVKRWASQVRVKSKVVA